MMDMQPSTAFSTPAAGRFQPSNLSRTERSTVLRRHDAIRSEWRAPIAIFGSLFVAATVARAIDLSSFSGPIDLDPVKVLSQQHSSVPPHHDLMLLGCHQQSASQKSSLSSASGRCEQRVPVKL